MSKGYPRGLSRGNAQKQAITKIRLPINHEITSVATGAAIGFGSTVIGGLPEGQLLILASAIQVAFTGPTSGDLSDTFDGDFGVGSTPAADATISAGDEDFIAETALGAATAEVSPTLNVVNGSSHVLDNTDGDLELNLNLLIDAADQTDDTSVVITATGVLEVTLITMLDD